MADLVRQKNTERKWKQKERTGRKESGKEKGEGRKSAHIKIALPIVPSDFGLPMKCISC